MRLNWPALAIVAVIFLYTLTPSGAPVSPDEGGSGLSLCIACGSRGLADLVLNVVLFAPLGVALGRRSKGMVLPIAIGGLLSLFIELKQLGIPGRDPSLSDLFANTLGTAVGVMLARTSGWWFDPPVARASRLSLAALGLALITLGLSAWLLAPSLPPTTYYGQWTADFANLDRYQGRIVDVSADGLPIPSRRVEDSEALRRRLAEGAELRIDAIAGPPPVGLAPIFSIYDDRQREIFFLGAKGEDAVLRFRMRSTALRLDQADLRLPDAFQGVEAGEPLRVRFWRSGSAYCLEINGRRDCASGFGLADGWGVLHFVEGLHPSLKIYHGFLWLAGLFIPAGFWLRRRRDAMLAGVAVVAGLALLPLVVGVLATPPVGYLAALAGLGLGAAFRLAASIRARRHRSIRS